MKQYISLLPHLNPAKFFASKKKSDVFPLNNPHQNFYFERNAIWHGIKALGLQPDDEVLMPAYNSDTEEQVLEHAGLKIIYHDVNKDTRVDFFELEKHITSKTKALYVIHYFGFAQDMNKARAFCDKHNLVLIEDCALSFLSKNEDLPLGSYGDVGFFCLRKFVEIPNGGTLVINRQNINISTSHLQSPSRFSTFAETLGLLLNYISHVFVFFKPIADLIKNLFRRTLGDLRTPSGDPVVEKEKFNWKSSVISERILERLDYHAIAQKRLANYAYLKEQLLMTIDSSDRVSFFSAKPQKGFIPFCLPLLVDDNMVWKKALGERGIESGAWWRHDKRAHEKELFINNKYLREHLLEIPIQHTLSKADLDYIVTSIKEII